MNPIYGTDDSVPVGDSSCSLSLNLHVNRAQKPGNVVPYLVHAADGHWETETRPNLTHAYYPSVWKRRAVKYLHLYSNGFLHLWKKSATYEQG